MPGLVEDIANVNNQAPSGFGLYSSNFILVFVAWRIIFPSFTSGVFFVYPTNQLPDAIVNKLISGVSSESWRLLSVVIRTDRSADTGDILNDASAPVSLLAAKLLRSAWRLQTDNGKISIQVNMELNGRLANLFLVLLKI